MVPPLISPWQLLSGFRGFAASVTLDLFLGISWLSMGSVPLSSPLLSLSLVRLSPNVPVVPLVWLGGIMGGWSGSWDKQLN